MMNKREKEVLHTQFNNEQEALKKLKEIYQKALNDINDRIAILVGREATADENVLQSIIYQKQYQQALKQQISGILDNLNGEQFKTVAEYLTKSYEDGFLGTMYDLHGQGIPLIFPIDQNQVIKAVQNESKISEGLYKRLGEDTNKLKKSIANNVSRGIAQGLSYGEIAHNIAGSMIGYNPKNPGGAFARAMRISRTEGHRISQKATFDAQHKAKSKGADILKQWDSTLDARTRDSHARLDGEIRELDEKFSNGLLYPGDKDGAAAEVINCRCVCLQRAKWALDEEELNTLKERAAYFELDKTKDFDEFKRKYINAVDNSNESGIIKSGAISGARNPFGKKAEAHAMTYYESVRHMKTDVAHIAKTTGFSEKEIQEIKNFIFYDKHDLGEGEPKRFEPDFMMAESWKRLIDGKPEAHDITMIKHEFTERNLMTEGYSQEEAHIMASKKYNYNKEAMEFYDKIEKYRD